MAQSGSSPRAPRLRLTAAERSEQAFAAARRLILAGGIEAASVRNVATEADMATGSLRHVFPSHESLFIALMSDSATRAETRIQGVFARSAGRACAVNTTTGPAPGPAGRPARTAPACPTS